MKDRNIVKAVVCALGIAAGAMLIFKGMEVDSFAKDFVLYPGEFGGSVTRIGACEFGADYYTESYRAMAFGANAASGTFQMLRKTITALMTFGGGAICCGFGVGLCNALGIGLKKAEEPKKADAKPVQPADAAAPEAIEPKAPEAAEEQPSAPSTDEETGAAAPRDAAEPEAPAESEEEGAAPREQQPLQ